MIKFWNHNTLFIAFCQQKCKYLRKFVKHRESKKKKFRKSFSERNLWANELVSKLYWFKKCICCNRGFYCFWKRASWKIKPVSFATSPLRSAMWHKKVKVNCDGVMSIGVSVLNKEWTTIWIKWWLMTDGMAISCGLNWHRAYDNSFKSKWNSTCSSMAKGNT